jgi:hypothetical protein
MRRLYCKKVSFTAERARPAVSGAAHRRRAERVRLPTEESGASRGENAKSSNTKLCDLSVLCGKNWFFQWHHEM